MKNNASVSEIDEPKWLIETETGQEIARCGISKCCVTKASATKVEECCDDYGSGRGFLHSLLLCWWRSQCILLLIFHLNRIKIGFLISKISTHSLVRCLPESLEVWLRKDKKRQCSQELGTLTILLHLCFLLDFPLHFLQFAVFLHFNTQNVLNI